MDHRCRVAVGGLIVLMAVVLVATIPTSGQTPSAAGRTSGDAAKAYTPSRTPDGQPDLQGFWTNSTYTPLERPKNVTKAFYTAEEVAAAEKRAAERAGEQTKPGTLRDVHPDNYQFGLTRSQSTVAPNLRTSLIVDPPDGRLPPVTAEAEKRAADDAARRASGMYDAVQNMSLVARCIIMQGSGPPMLNAAYNNNYHIVQGPGYVMILVEMIHDARIIPLDGRPQVSKNIHQWMGDSRGHWEGETLVVETTNFNGKHPILNGPNDGPAAGYPSQKLRVIEWFTRVADDRILYKFTVEDEATWLRPWTAEMVMQKTEGPIFEHACHEGNYGVTHTLAGARAEEKRAAKNTKKSSN